MYVCICHGVSDRDIQKAVMAGASSMHELQEQLQVATGCGQCGEHAQECMNQVLLQSMPVVTAIAA